MRTSNTIVLASTNVDKFREMTALLSQYPEFQLVSPDGLLSNANKIGFVETGTTYLENSSAKARLVNKGCHYPALADDSGIEIEALGGKPGVYSQKSSMQKVLEEMKGQTNRKARFVSTLTLVIEGVMLHATGVLEGTLADAPRGTNGFGYDPIFIPAGESRTFAEMSESEKNRISHRALALAQIMEQVKTHGIQFAKP